MIGQYDHLNETDPPQIPLTMKALVALIRKMNYGQQRFLSELVRQRETSDDEKYPQSRKHTAMLRELLEKGFF